MPFYRPTWVEISSDAFLFNLNQIKKITTPQTRVLAVLKADAYGHGAPILASLAEKNDIFSLGVSSLEEGISLRENHIKMPILILGGIYPLKNFSVAIEHGLTPTVASLEGAHVLKEAALQARQSVEFHLKIDTGMGRIGVSPSGAKPILEWLKNEPLLKLAGIYSHFSCADTDPLFSDQQLSQLQMVQGMVKTLGFENVLFHIANSAALLSNKKYHLDLVRPGLALYGVAPIPLPKEIKILPVLSWQTRLIFLKKVVMNTPISYGATFRTKQESEIATLPVGYADGLPRLASNKGFVLIKGKRCPIVGRVTMDHTMVDVSGVRADVGEPAVLIGQQGDESISAADWASWAETNSYEILCGISKRVPRVPAPGGN